MPLVRLRPTTEEDLDFVLAAEAAADDRPFVTSWSRDQHRRALDDPDVAHRIAEGENGRPSVS